MFASLALALATQQVTIPLGRTPRQIERPKAPIEESGPQWGATCKDWDEWDKPAPPVRLHGNTYLVGSCGISAILIVGDEGHLLIDSGTESGAKLVADNIRQLGFRLRDVKYLLHSHEHHDHVGGMARLQQLTGATLVSSEAARRALETGVVGADDPQSGIDKPYPAATVGRVIADGEDILLGNVRLFAIATPGHTPGAMSWRWDSCDGGVCRTMVYADSLSPVSRDDYRFGNRPNYLAAYRASIAKIADVRCEILLTPHPSSSQMRDRIIGQQPLFDVENCKNYAAKLTKNLDERLAKEKAAR